MKHRTLAEYGDRYDHVEMHRDDGVLLVRFHTDGGELHWGAGPHDELGWAFADIAGDPDNDVVVLTGTGETFCAHFNAGDSDHRPPRAWDRVHREGKRLLMNLLDVPVPMLAAINGPATVHAEIGLLCDVVVAADTTIFQDAPHFTSGLVPGDGVHVLWPLLLGPNRGRSFLLTGETLTATQALDLGVVAEVTPAARTLPRTLEIARTIAQQPLLTRRYAREAITQRLKRELLGDLSFGLVLEGLAAADSWPAGRAIVPPSQLTV